ncbi:MAG: VOC family protein [Pseudomonadota bacterium]
MATLFHLSTAVSDLDVARGFYCDRLGCRLGRVGPDRIDVDFFGHHVVMHLNPDEADQGLATMDSDGDRAPLRHFGVIVDEATWESVLSRLIATDTYFDYGPKTIRGGTIAEQKIVMMPDGCGNVVEIKCMPAERVFDAGESPS